MADVLISIGADTRGAERGLAQLEKLASGFGDAFRVGAQAAATAALGFGTAVLAMGASFNAMSQQVHQAFEATLGSAQAARGLTSEIIELNRTAAFSRQAFLDAGRTLVGFGVAADQVTQTLDAMQNTIVAAGQGEAEFARLAEIMGKVAAQGRLYARELQQLTAIGVPAIKLLATSMGVSADEVRRLTTAGAIGFAELSAALSTNAGAVESYAQTWAGALGLMKAGMRDLGSDLVAPFVALERGGAAVEVLTNMAAALQHIRTSALPGIMGGLDAFASGLVSLSAAARDLITSLQPADFQRIFGTLQRGAPIFAGLAASLATFGSNALTAALNLGRLNPAVAGLVAGLAAVPQVRDAFGDLLAALAPLGPVLAELTASLGELVGDLAAGLAAALGPVIEAVGQFVEMFVELPAPIRAAGFAIAAAVAFAFSHPLIAAISAAAAALTLFGSTADQVADALPGLAGGVDELTRGLELMATQGIATGGLAELKANFDALRGELDKTVESMGVVEKALRDTENPLAGIGNLIAWLGEQFGILEAPVGTTAEVMEAAQVKFANFDAALARMAAGGNLQDFIMGLRLFAEQAAAAGLSLEEAMQLLPGAEAELQRLHDTLGLSVDQLVELGAAAQEAGQALTSGDLAAAAPALERIAAAFAHLEDPAAALKLVLPDVYAQLARADLLEAFAAGQQGMAEAIDATTEAIKAQQSAIREMVDPIFAFAQAQERVTEAQAAFDSAVSRFGANSTQAAQASRDLTLATLDLDAAITAAAGRLDPAAFRDWIATMVELGLITHEQAAAMIEDLQGLAGQVDELDAMHAGIEAEVDSKTAEEGLALLREGADELDERDIAMLAAIHGGEAVLEALREIDDLTAAEHNAVVRVIGDQAREQLGGLRAELGALAAAPFVAEVQLDPTPAVNTFEQVRGALGGAEPIRMQLNLDTALAHQTQAALAAEIGATTATGKLSLDDKPGRAIFAAITADINRSVSTGRINMNDAPARGVFNALVRQINSTTATLTINARTVGAAAGGGRGRAAPMAESRVLRELVGLVRREAARVLEEDGDRLASRAWR